MLIVRRLGHLNVAKTKVSVLFIEPELSLRGFLNLLCV
jgi:hypothetical protein